MYNSNMAANESVFLRSIRDVNVVGEVLRDLRASVAERAFYRLDWLLDIVNRYADSLSTTVYLDQVHFLLRESKWVTILGDPGADSGDEGKSKQAEKYGTKEK